MSTTSEKSGKIHQGRNVRRFREMLGLKQEALSIALGEDWNQKRISLLEAKETLEPEVLALVAKALKVPEEAIKNFDEEMAVNVISNTFSSHDNSTLNAVNIQPSFNPIDKLIEVVEDNKKLYEENKNLYERLLKSEREKIEILRDIKA
ncbi:helix-turn-helix domain-containing protein [Desertivirga xinjiangensis]|uniref:helix-turn-helix domain-containing protein n=1 Tax=Desertivirga xinjiangensis TaxID=539206 RepID=UPI00210AFA9D|nr:helix-turn-helix transcriptional regulator [Pedobacter xinjiangensis]